MQAPWKLLLAAVGFFLAACQSPGPPSIPAYEMRERIRELAPGQTRSEVRRVLGSLPVRKPGHPDAPFATPHRVGAFTTPAGDRVRLEVYVVATRPAEGACPDVQYDDAPVAYLNDRVVALDWDALEWRWREWGGDLGVLRALQDRFVCVQDAPHDVEGAARELRPAVAAQGGGAGGASEGAGPLPVAP